MADHMTGTASHMTNGTAGTKDHKINMDYHMTSDRQRTHSADADHAMAARMVKACPKMDETVGTSSPIQGNRQNF